MYKKLLIFFCLFPALVLAETYRFSGGKGNMAQIIASKVLLKAYQRAGIKIELVFMTLEESLQQSNSGTTDGEMARIAKISRLYPNLVQVPVSIVSVEAVAFSKNFALRVDRWGDLGEQKITIVKGAKFIERASEGLDRAFVSTFSEAFERLDKNLTEVVVAPKMAGWFLIHKKKYTNIRMVSSSLKTMRLYHFVHKKNSHLIPLITPYLEKMAQSGELAYMRNAQLLKFTVK